MTFFPDIILTRVQSECSPDGLRSEDRDNEKMEELLIHFINIISCIKY